MQRTGDGAVPLALGAFPQVDERDVRACMSQSNACAAVTAQPRCAIFSWARPTFMLAGTATSIIFGLRQLQIVHQLDIFVDGFHLQPRIAAPLLADGADRIALVVVRRIDQRVVGQFQQPVEDRIRIAARGSPFWKSVRPVPRISSVSPVNTRSGIVKRIGIVGVARRIDDVEDDALDVELVAVAHRRIETTSALVFSPITVMQWVWSRSAPSPVIWSACRCVSTALTSLQVELVDEMHIAVDLLEHGIDDQRLAAWPACEQIGIGAGRWSKSWRKIISKS